VGSTFEWAVKACFNYKHIHGASVERVARQLGMQLARHQRLAPGVGGASPNPAWQGKGRRASPASTIVPTS
jgi:hypothetical protein